VRTALDAIREYAPTIDTIARRIENAVHDHTDAAPDGTIAARAA
jgi:hypothetical protein